MLHALKADLDQVSLAVNFRIAPSIAGSIRTRRSPGEPAVALDKASEFIGVESLVADEKHCVSQNRR
jgi:hypothetical protein